MHETAEDKPRGLYAAASRARPVPRSLSLARFGHKSPAAFTPTILSDCCTGAAHTLREPAQLYGSQGQSQRRPSPPSPLSSPPTSRTAARDFVVDRRPASLSGPLRLLRLRAELTYSGRYGTVQTTPSRRSALQTLAHAVHNERDIVLDQSHFISTNLGTPQQGRGLRCRLAYKHR